MMHSWIVAAALALSLGAAQAAIKEEPVEYKDKDTTMKGVIVYDDASQSRRPGVIVVHEWWGITPHVREEARRLAGSGFTAFVATYVAWLPPTSQSSSAGICGSSSFCRKLTTTTTTPSSESSRY